MRLDIVSTAALKIGVQVSFKIMIFLGSKARSGLVGQVVALYSVFLVGGRREVKPHYNFDLHFSKISGGEIFPLIFFKQCE